jgi:hypothetical protein
MDFRKIINLVESQVDEDISDVVGQLSMDAEQAAVNSEEDSDEVYLMYQDCDSFTKAYVEAIFFTEAHSDNPELEHATIEQFTMASMAKIKADCRKFQQKVNDAGIDLDEACLKVGQYSAEELAGHDFWLTRNHHGAGFWDGDWEDQAEKELTQISHEFGEISIILDDNDRLVYG